MQVKYVLEACLYVDDLAQEEGRHVFFHCGRGPFLLFNPAETLRSGGIVYLLQHAYNPVDWYSWG